MSRRKAPPDSIPHRRRPGRLAALLALVLCAALGAASSASGPAHADDATPLPITPGKATKPPGQPTGLRVDTEPGSLSVLVHWNEVEGADSYTLRWREGVRDTQLNKGVSVASSHASITVADYGEWVVKVYACRDGDCGRGKSTRFQVEPAPEPADIPEPAPPPLQVGVSAGATEVPVGEQVTLSADIANAPAGPPPAYRWEMGDGEAWWFTLGTDSTVSYLTAAPEAPSFRVAVTYASGASATSDPITITFMEPEPEPPARPTGLQVSTEQASLDVLLDWNDVDGADGYLVRWRLSGPRQALNDGVRPTPSSANVTVAGYGTWVVRVQACNDAGCSAATAWTFEVEPAPEPDGFRSVCDRTRQVRDALVAATGKACGDIAAEDLAGVGGLDLSGTGLRTLEDGDLSGLTGLKDLKLKNNPNLRQLSGNAFADQNALENVNLNGAGLTSLSAGQFAGNTNLVSVHLAGNRLTSVPAGVFSGSTNLGFIDLSRNGLTSLPATVFDGLEALWYLDLGRNSLTGSGLPSGVFSDLAELDWLRLNDQRGRDTNTFQPTTTPTLTSLTSGVFTGLSEVTSLDLANNGLTDSGLPSNIFQPLSALETLALFGNSGVTTTANKGVRSGATVTLITAAPTGFTADPTNDGRVKLKYDNPNDSDISHQYRYLADGTWSAWTNVTGHFLGGDGKWQVNIAGLTSGTAYLFELRAREGGAVSYRARHAEYIAVFGTSGADTLSGSEYRDHITGGPGADVIRGMGGADWLRGAGGSDTLYANGGDGYDPSSNLLEGGAGNDTLHPALGSDRLNGGSGTDTVSYAHLGASGRGIVINLADSTRSTGEARGDTFESIEKIVGSGGNDVLIGDGSANTLSGGAGKDRLISRGGADTLDGGAGTDEFYIFPGAGDVTINNYEDHEDVFLCIDGVKIKEVPPGGGSIVYLLVDRTGRALGSVTLAGRSSVPSTATRSRLKTDGPECQRALTPAPQEEPDEPLRVWWTERTPKMQESTNSGVAAIRLFLRVEANTQAGALCRLQGPKIGKTGTGNSTINCPPGTLTSKTPVQAFEDGDDVYAETATVTAVATAGDETASAMVQVFEVGGHVAPRTTLSAGNGKVAVAWSSENVVTQDPRITEHKVQYRVMGDTGDWTDSPQALAATETEAATISGLTNGTTYEVRVRTINDAGDTDDSTSWRGPWSHDLVTPRAHKSEVPAQVEDLSVTTASNATSLSLSWSNWVYDESRAAVHYYQVEYKEQSATAWTAAPKVVGTNAEVLTGLTAGTAYDVRVRAHNANGHSETWTTGTGTTPAALSGTLALSRASGTDAIQADWTLSRACLTTATLHGITDGSSLEATTNLTGASGSTAFGQGAFLTEGATVTLRCEGADVVQQTIAAP